MFGKIFDDSTWVWMLTVGSDTCLWILRAAVPSAIALCVGIVALWAIELVVSLVMEATQ